MIRLFSFLTESPFDQIGTIASTLQEKRLTSSTNKTVHEINVPNDTLHFLIFGATSYAIHGYGMVASTSSGSIDAETLKLEGITITTSNGKVTCNIGATARPFYMLDVLIRGNEYCSLS